MTFETERLILRPWAESDAEDLYEYAKDPRVGPAAGWPVHTSVENSRDIIRNVLSAPETYAVVLKENGRAIGSVGLKIGEYSDLDIPETQAEFGCWLGVPYWGQGLIPEALEALQEYAFATLGMEMLWYGYYAENSKSKRVCEKCGFTYRYTKENIYVSLIDAYKTEHISCITKEEWNKK